MRARTTPPHPARDLAPNDVRLQHRRARLVRQVGALLLEEFVEFSGRVALAVQRRWLHSATVPCERSGCLVDGATAP